MKSLAELSSLVEVAERDFLSRDLAYALMITVVATEVVEVALVRMLPDAFLATVVMVELLLVVVVVVHWVYPKMMESFSMAEMELLAKLEAAVEEDSTVICFLS